MSFSALWQAIALGVVQGITEFLPVSSSGHLVILQYLMGVSEPMELTIVLHVGTLLSIAVVFRKELFEHLQRPQLCLLIILATIPVGIVGLAFKESFDRIFETPLVAGCGLLVTAMMLAFGQRLQRDQDSLESVRPRQALFVGMFQAAALVPGVSRSGSTIAGGLLCGLRRDAATTFSFFIAIPAIAAASLVVAQELLQDSSGQHDLLPLVAGGVTAFLVGIAALRLLVGIVTQRKLHWFAWYCLLVGAVTIVWQLLLPPVSKTAA